VGRKGSDGRDPRITPPLEKGKGQVGGAEKTKGNASLRGKGAGRRSWGGRPELCGHLHRGMGGRIFWGTREEA